MFSQVPNPTASESCEDFCIRAHKALMQVVPSAGDRNQMIWNAWDLSRGSISTERYRAQERFSGYRVIPNVCHFAEHKTGTKSGVMTVGESDVVAICKNMNRRISDVGLYPPLIDRHTTDNPNDHRRGILGYAGNYRVGMIGEGDLQRYAIFGDEFHKPEHLEELNDKPRRSVELMRYKDSSRNFFDPIACLGADSPRIEIPPAYYSADRDESIVETIRYSVPVYAGSSNTFIPAFGNDEKERLQAASEPDTEKRSMLEPNDLTQVVDAVKNALQPYLQWIETQMHSSMGASPQGDALSLAGNQPGGQPPGQSGAPGQAPHSPASQSHAAPASHPPGSPSPKPPEQYMHGQQPMRFEAEEDEEVEKERYAALEKKYLEAIAELGQVKTRLGALETERTDAIRSHRLHELCSRYDGLVDFDEEAGKVLYSAGAEMSDEEFEDRLQTIEHYAAKAAPPAGMVPDGVAEDDGDEKPVSRERYSARVQDEVVRRITDAIGRGQTLDYNTVEGEVCKEFGIE